MKTLNPDILEEIIPHFSGRYDDEEKKEDAEALKKFMSSGKEPFYAALRYFSHTTEVYVCRSDLHLAVHVKRFPLKKCSETNTHYIPYDFEYLDAILNAFPKTLLLGINVYPESVAGKRALAILIHFKKFKSLNIHTQDLPDEYIELFKTEPDLDTIKIDDCDGYNPSFLDFLEMDAKHYVVGSTLPIFIQESHNLPLLQTFPAVKDLQLDCGQPSEEFIFTLNRIKQLLLIIPDRFPNLQTLNVDYTEFDDELNIDWHQAYQEMITLQPQEFRSCVSPQLKGSISFSVCDTNETFGDFVSQLDEAPYVKIINDGYGLGRIVREFEIHDGLTFMFELHSFAK